ncbi:hypothetical protein V1514DRAFT_328391 [Lipomyces japonicus]|uniref:uncharacterized protein n=1 Tax=Lipomyces japonicus TaxID=56871 RepID=UPI0034CD1358
MVKSQPAFKEVRDAGTTASLSRLRKKIRDLDRLLKRAADAEGNIKKEKNTTAIAKREQERALRALKSELRAAEDATKNKKLSDRYHKVRFFERRKAARKVEKAKKRVAAAISESEKKREEMAAVQAETELAYIALFPRERKYVSLYVADALQNIEEPVKETDGDTERKRKEWWTTTKQRLAAGEINIDDLLFGRGIKKPFNSHISKFASTNGSSEYSNAEENRNISASDVEIENDDDEDEFFEK